MTHFNRDIRDDLLKKPLDLHSVLTGRGAHLDPALTLRRGSVEIAKADHGGALPPIPQTDNERAQCSYFSDEYRKRLVSDPHSGVPVDSVIVARNFSYPARQHEVAGGLQFLVECSSPSDRYWYCCASGLGVFRYHKGPVATQVKCPPGRVGGFWETPLVSIGAFVEDRDRIEKFGVKLLQNEGDRSYLLTGAMQAIERQLGPEATTPERVLSVGLGKVGPASCLLNIRVKGERTCGVQIEICALTWVIKAKVLS